MLALHKGTHAMYEALKLSKIHSLSINSQLDLFDKLVKPTLLYGCEIWGLGNIEIIERVHIKVCKLFLQLKNLTPTYMIYGERGDISYCFFQYFATFLFQSVIYD